jgi:hypothetical protein
MKLHVLHPVYQLAFPSRNPNSCLYLGNILVYIYIYYTFSEGEADLHMQLKTDTTVLC